MRSSLTLLTVAAALVVGPAAAQQQKPQPKKVQAKKAAAAPTGPKIRHQCKVGPYEKQTRLVMETVRDKPVYVAYWSSDGSFHCSFESWPGDGRAKWLDSSAGTVISLISGTMLIEKTKDKFLIHARDVDRMPYCGTFGQINGILTVPTKRGTNCDWKETEGEAAGRLNPEEPSAEAAPPTPTTEAAPPAQSAEGAQPNASVAAAVAPAPPAH
jgi:hypothetical protein